MGASRLRVKYTFGELGISLLAEGRKIGRKFKLQSLFEAVIWNSEIKDVV